MIVTENRLTEIFKHLPNQKNYYPNQILVPVCEIKIVPEYMYIPEKERDTLLFVKIETSKGVEWALSI